MPIFKIDAVRINGKNQAFGGYIYDVDSEIGLVDNPTKISISFINASGNYFEPELSGDVPYKIQIGNLPAGNYYAISRDIINTATQKILKVDFVDGSLILNRIFIGLYKRHGDENTNIPGLVIVGREIHPCDANGDGVFDGEDVLQLELKSRDPCELRCASDLAITEPILVDCINKEITDIFEIKYTFTDLLNAIQGKTITGFTNRTVTIPFEDEGAATVNIPFALPDVPDIVQLQSNSIKIGNIPANINNSYLNAYSGKLREVLKNWCADFGWSFYWENDTLNFIDTRQRIQPFPFNFGDIDSTTDHKTIEGTVARGFISQYLEPGIIAKTECEQSRPYTLNCLTLGDLFGSAYLPVTSSIIDVQGDYSNASQPFEALDSLPNPNVPNDAVNKIEYIDDFQPDGMAVEKLEVSCVLAYYSEYLRHLWNLWEYYGISSAAQARLNQGKWMDRLGQMKILNVFAADSSGPSLTKYKQIMETSIDSTKGKMLPKSETDLIQANGGYFVAVARSRVQGNVDFIDTQFKIEENLATNFIGRHWARSYVSPFMGQTPQIFPNGQYFGALATNVKDLPFANFGHTYESPIAQMVSSFIQRQRNDFRQYNYLGFAQGSSSHDFEQNISTKLVRSIVYTQKETADRWNPLKNVVTQLNATIQQNQPLMFKKIDLSTFSNDKIRPLAINDSLTQLVPETSLDKVELYIFYPGTLPVVNDFVDNPNEENPTYKESFQSFELTTVGLSSKKCVRYTVQGTPIYTPAGSSVLFNDQQGFKFKFLSRDSDTSEFTNPIYKIFITNTEKNRGILQKTEAILINPPDITGTIETDFTVKQLTNDSTKFLAQLDNLCRVSPAQLLAIHDILSQNLTYSINVPIQSKSYKIMGLNLPNNLSIANGLEKLHVQIDGQGGVFTEVTIGNSLFTPPNPEATEKILEVAGIADYWKARLNPLK